VASGVHRQESERLARYEGGNGTKVTLVERRDVDRVESLSECDERGVGESESASA